MIAHIVLFTPKAEVKTDAVRSFAQLVLEILRICSLDQRAMLGKAVWLILAIHVLWATQPISMLLCRSLRTRLRSLTI